MANCETIYYQSTNGTILLGDFLYQNQAQTIPASNGYYSDAANGKWYETDAEGVVINSGSCLDSGVYIASLQPTAFEACLSASLCATASTYLTYDVSLSSSRLDFSRSIWVSSNEYPYSTLTTGSAEVLLAAYITGGNQDIYSGSVNYPIFTGSNSIAFTGSLTGSNHGYAVARRATGSRAFISDLANSYFQSVTESMAVDIWFKANSGANGTGKKILFGNANTIDNTQGWTVQTNYNQPGDIAFQMSSGPNLTATNTVVVSTTESFADNKWHYASITYNPSGSISGSQLVSASSLFTIVVDGKTRDYSKSGGNLIDIRGNSGSLQNGIGFSVAICDPFHTPIPQITQFYNGRIGKLTLYNTGSSLPNNAFLRYQYYASRSIFNN
jgi:hypothetical protein